MGYVESLRWRLAHDGTGDTVRAVRNFVRWNLHKNFKPQQHYRSSVFNHTMYVDPRDSGISEGLAINQYRERGHTKILRQHVEPGMTVVDLGANIGYNTLLFAAEVGPTGTVHAIEPHPDNFSLLTKNIDANDYQDRVKTYECAIADSEGEVELLLDSKSNLHRVSESPTNHESKSMTVRSTTVDSLLAEWVDQIDFVRMDIEGYEETVLSKECMGTVLDSSAPDLLFEVHSGSYSEQMEQVVDDLLERGYYPVLMVSNGKKPKKYFELGYEPAEIIHTGGHTRGMYSDVRREDLPELLLSQPNPTRCAYLSCID